MSTSAAQHHLVLILARDFASRLATAVFLVDERGSVIYYNEAAERVLGRKYIEGAGMDADEWGTLFAPRDDEGNPVELSEMPLGVAILERRPDHRMLRIRSAAGTEHRIEATAFPLFAHEDECLGAIAIFWERSDEDAPGGSSDDPTANAPRRDG